MTDNTNPLNPTRRAFLRQAVTGAGGLAAGWLLPNALTAQTAPALVVSAQRRPQLPYGVASGDILTDRAIVWSRSDRPARMIVHYATTASFQDARRINGPVALENSDYTARLELTGLPAGQAIFYRVQFENLDDPGVLSEPVSGHFRTAPAERRDILFQWSGDTAGQGYGINEDWGGMKIYETLRQATPDFFIHCGDMIYADNPLKPEMPLPDGSVWKNLVTPAKAKVAETLAEFRGNFAYNLLDANVRRFNAEVPLIAQWDDHEVIDNWYPGRPLTDSRYTVKNASLLAAYGKQALLEYTPLRIQPRHPERLYRQIPYGPSLDVFVIDMRSYRGPNSDNRQTQASAATDFLGRQQVRWLKQALQTSTATWKVIAADMPLGLLNYDNFKTKEGFEGLANGDGPALGRELELADLLSFIKAQGIKNVVWVTADVHYAAAHYYDPNRAQFQDFLPFWEFVAGPLNAGTFGPNALDNTFGPEVKFQKTPEPGQFNLPPSAGMQFYGQVKIAGDTEVMTVTLHDLTGTTLYSVDLEPSARAQ